LHRRSLHWWVKTLHRLARRVRFQWDQERLNSLYLHALQEAQLYRLKIKMVEAMAMIQSRLIIRQQ
jgi:hypothetical protein